MHRCTKERLNESSFLLRENYEWEQDCLNEGNKATLLTAAASCDMASVSLVDKQLSGVNHAALTERS